MAIEEDSTGSESISLASYLIHVRHPFYGVGQGFSCGPYQMREEFRRSPDTTPSVVDWWPLSLCCKSQSADTPVHLKSMRPPRLLLRSLTSDFCRRSTGLTPTFDSMMRHTS